MANRTMLLVILVALLGSGCATMARTSPSNTAERAVNVGSGAVIGAGVGYAAGHAAKLLGATSRSAGPAGALIGAVVGAGIGSLVTTTEERAARPAVVRTAQAVYHPPVVYGGTAGGGGSGGKDSAYEAGYWARQKDLRHAQGQMDAEGEYHPAVQARAAQGWRTYGAPTQGAYVSRVQQCTCGVPPLYWNIRRHHPTCPLHRH